MNALPRNVLILEIFSAEIKYSYLERWYVLRSHYKSVRFNATQSDHAVFSKLKKF